MEHTAACVARVADWSDADAAAAAVEEAAAGEVAEEAAAEEEEEAAEAEAASAAARAAAAASAGVPATGWARVASALASATAGCIIDRIHRFCSPDTSSRGR
jgi:hypothetical protein